MRNRLAPKRMTLTFELFRSCIKVMLTIALHSTLNISETDRDRGYIIGSKGPSIGNGVREIKW